MLALGWVNLGNTAWTKTKIYYTPVKGEKWLIVPISGSNYCYFFCKLKRASRHIWQHVNFWHEQFVLLYSRLYISKHNSFISRYVVFVSLNIISYSVFELNMLYNVYLFWRERVLVDFYNSDKTFFFKQMEKIYFKGQRFDIC